jgi:AcrR family transcriptional regulator
MPRPRLTEEEINEMREATLKAAFNILQEQGPGGLSIRAIADRMGVSHMMLYSYFENREEIISALRNYARLHHVARHKEALDRAQEGAAEEVMRETLEGYVQFAHERPQAFQFIWSGRRGGGYQHDASGAEGMHMHPPRRPSSPHYADQLRHSGGIHHELDFLEQLIKLGIEQRTFVERDPAIAALMTTSMIIGPLLISQMSGLTSNENKRKLEAEAIEATMHYLTGKN